MIKISHGTRIDEMSDKNGYGYATKNMLDSLRRLGYEVNPNDSTADVEIWFDQPHHWKFSTGPYRIGYHPWESTQLLRDQGWLEAMNSCDEIWTPSPLIADWYKNLMGIKPPVYVYEHGVDPIWKPKERKVDGTFKFLHIGGEAVRKGATEAMQAIRLGFPDNADVELNMKIISRGWNIGRLRRVNILNNMLSLEELIELYHTNHVFVYPSYGEGFGLTPLQAMATGMPTITLPAWAPYEQFIDPYLRVDSKLTKSPWPMLHPGNMFKPDMASLIDAMRYAYENYDEVQGHAQARVDELLSYYDWDRLTAEAFGNLQGRLENN